MSGGGIRGLYSIAILAKLEQYLADETSNQDYRIADHFDLITGTSIGGILALGLTYGISARDLHKLLDENRKDIFPKPLCKTWSSIRQLFGAKYSPSQLKTVLHKTFGNATIGDLKQRVAIPTVNYTKGQPQVFKTPHCPEFRDDHKVKIIDVALATSAAPTYFPIHQIGNCWYVDGGLAANSPSLVGFHEASHFLKQENVSVLSIGTMGGSNTANQEKSKNPGYLFSWGLGSKLIALTLSANEGLHDYIASHLIKAGKFLHIDDTQSPHQSEILALDNSSDGAADTLTGRGEMKAKEIINSEVFQEFIQHKALAPELFYGPNTNTA